MKTIDIKCQTCGSAIELTKTLAAPLLESQKQEYEQLQNQRNAAHRQREMALDKKEKALSLAEEEIQKRVTAQLQSKVSEKQQQFEQKYGHQITALEQQIKDQQAEFLTAQKSELAARKARDEALRAKESAELEIQRQVDQRISAEREDATTKAKEAAAVEIAKQAQVLETLRKQISDMERKADPTAAHIHGDIQEQNITGKLQLEFRQDTFDRVSKGARGADIIQRVMQPNGRIAGTILIEVKNTQNWDNNWPTKLKDDQRVAGADIAVIVSRTLPKGVSTFTNLENVWVCSDTMLLSMISCLRAGLLGIAKEKAAAMVSSERKDQIFEYLKSNSFAMRIATIMDAHEAMQTELYKEKQSQMNYWAKREKSLHRMLEGISGLSGDFQHLGGPDVLENANESLPELNSDDTSQFIEANLNSRSLVSTDSRIETPPVIDNTRPAQPSTNMLEVDPTEERPEDISISGFSAIPSGAHTASPGRQTLKILKLLVKKGQSVKSGTRMVSVLDENQNTRIIEANTRGRIRSVALNEGDDLTEDEIHEAITIIGFYS